MWFLHKAGCEHEYWKVVCVWSFIAHIVTWDRELLKETLENMKELLFSYIDPTGSSYSQDSLWVKNVFIIDDNLCHSGWETGCPPGNLRSLGQSALHNWLAQLGEVVASQCETDYSEALKNLPVSALVTSRLQQSPVLCMENVRKTFISKVLHYCWNQDITKRRNFYFEGNCWMFHSFTPACGRRPDSRLARPHFLVFGVWVFLVPWFLKPEKIVS